MYPGLYVHSRNLRLLRPLNAHEFRLARHLDTAIRHSVAHLRRSGEALDVREPIGRRQVIGNLQVVPIGRRLKEGSLPADHASYVRRSSIDALQGHCPLIISGQAATDVGAVTKHQSVDTSTGSIWHIAVRRRAGSHCSFASGPCDTRSLPISRRPSNIPLQSDLFC